MYANVVRQPCSAAVALRQEAQAILGELQHLGRESDKIITDLSLTPPPASVPPAPPSGAGPGDLLPRLRNRRVEARQGLAKLKTTAGQLREERSKWWKFW